MPIIPPYWLRLWMCNLFEPIRLGIVNTIMLIKMWVNLWMELSYWGMWMSLNFSLWACCWKWMYCLWLTIWMDWCHSHLWYPPWWELHCDWAWSWTCYSNWNIPPLTNSISCCTRNNSLSCCTRKNPISCCTRNSSLSCKHRLPIKLHLGLINKPMCVPSEPTLQRRHSVHGLPTTLILGSWLESMSILPITTSIQGSDKRLWAMPIWSTSLQSQLM